MYCCSQFHIATTALQDAMSKNEKVAQTLETVEHLNSLLSWLRIIIDLLEAEVI